MQPNPIADTSKLLFPSLRFCIVSPNREIPPAGAHTKHTFLKFEAIAYFDDVLARFSKLDRLNDLVIDAARLFKEQLEEADFWSVSGASRGAALMCSMSKKLPAPLSACPAQLDTIASVLEPRVTSGQTLAKVPIFAGLTESELAFLTQHAVPRRYAAGELVFGEGEPCTGLYVVESGNVRIFKSSASGREQVLGVEGPGSSIAELPVFDGGNYPASVAAIDDATLLFVSKQDFQSLVLTHPQVALKVLRVVGARLRRLVGIIEELSFTTVRHRLASFLLRLAQSGGKRTSEGIEILLPASNQELASQIGTVRELVSRNLSRFQAEGLLKIEGRTITIRDPKTLEAELQSNH